MLRPSHALRFPVLTLFVAATATVTWSSPLAAQRSAAPAVSTAASAANATVDGAFSLEVPDVPVIDQHGAQLRFRSDLIAGRTVIVNFVFTTCTTVCPALTTAMRSLQRELGDRVGRDVRLISVSVDPTVDRPERLRAFADTFGAGPGWTFATGDRRDIDRLLKAFGAWAGDITAHSTTLLIGNPQTGRWLRSSGLAPAAVNLRLIAEITP